MGFLERLFKAKKAVLPCDGTDDCPFEYDRNPERDIEGMPFREDDPRSCPWFGHICPEFKEDFGLTVEELDIRATIHCGMVMMGSIARGEQDPNDAVSIEVLSSFEKMRIRYPESEFPQYY